MMTFQVFRFRSSLLDSLMKREQEALILQTEIGVINACQVNQDEAPSRST